MRTLTVSEALIALGNGEKITSDDFGGVLPFIHLVEDEIVWGDGKRYNGTISTSLNCSNIKIYKEFTYPMWFKDCENQVVRFESLQRGIVVIKGEHKISDEVGLISDDYLPHTGTQWQQVEEPKKMIKVAKYAINNDASTWYETTNFYKNDANCMDAQSAEAFIRRLDYTEIEVEDY